MFIVGQKPVWIFAVQVAGFEEIEEIDVTAASEAKAWRKAREEAEDLYINYNLTLINKI